MKFREALEALKDGKKIKLPHWKGYWELEDGNVMMHCKDGRILNIKETEDIIYTLSFIASEDWEVVDSDYEVSPVTTVRFGEAIRLMKLGKHLARKGWNGKGMFVVYQKAYPDGIPCNKQTAEAWGIQEGDLFKCNPYFQIKNVNGTHSMWVPSINDCLAEDWYVVD